MSASFGGRDVTGPAMTDADALLKTLFKKFNLARLVAHQASREAIFASYSCKKLAAGTSSSNAAA
jgi:hypothetical protein